MDWANEESNQINTDVQSADENSLIAAGSTEFQHPAPNLHDLSTQYFAGSNPGAVPIESSARCSCEHPREWCWNSDTLLQARSHFVLLNELQSASTTTEPQYQSNQRTHPNINELRYDALQNQGSHTLLNQRLQSNVFSLEPQFCLNVTVHNHPQSSASSGLGDYSHIFDSQKSLPPLDSQSNVLLAESQPSLGNLPYLFDDRQPLHDQPQSSVFQAQPQTSLDRTPHILDDQSVSLLASQLQSGVLPAQLQSGRFENLSPQKFSAAIINSRSNIPSNPVQFPNEQSCSIVIPLTPASAEYHNTSTTLTALVAEGQKRIRRPISCIGCRIQRIKALPYLYTRRLIC